MYKSNSSKQDMLENNVNAERNFKKWRKETVTSNGQ